MKKLLMLGLLLSVLTSACPNQETHNKVEQLIKDGYLKVNGKKLIIDSEKLDTLSPSDVNKGSLAEKEHVHDLISPIVEYAKHHKLKMELINLKQ